MTTVRKRRSKLFGFEHKGPFDITTVHDNRTVTIKYGNFNERINIRKLKRLQTKI